MIALSKIRKQPLTYHIILEEESVVLKIYNSVIKKANGKNTGARPDKNPHHQLIRKYRMPF